MSIFLALSLYWAYFLLRFIVGKYAAVILLTVTGFIVYHFVRRFKLTPVIAWVPVLVSVMFTVIYSAAFTEAAVTTYWAYFFVALFIHAQGYRLFKVASPGKIGLLGLVFAISVLPFLVFPSLSDLGVQPVDGAVEMGKKLKDYVQIDEATRYRAYFFHPGEMGQFAAAIFLIFSQSCKAAGQRLWFTRRTAFEILVYVALGGIVIASASTTGEILIAFSLVARVGPTFWLYPIPFVIALAQFTSQLFYARSVEDVLNTGSLWWRYNMAENVSRSLTLATFSPEKINAQANWMHSIYLDVSVLYGLIAVAVLFIGQTSLVFLRPYRTMAYGWSWLFIVVAAIMPIGSSAVYSAVACSLVYAQSTALRLSVKPRRQHT